METGEQANLQDRVLQILRARFEPTIDESQINSDTRLFAGGLDLDSIAMLDIIAGIEQEFNVTIYDEDILAEHFADVPSIIKFVKQKIDVGSRSGEQR